MTTKLLDRKVLVLGQHWKPVSIVTAADAICKLYQGKAMVLDNDYTQYNFQEWADFSELTDDEKYDLIKTSSISLPVPEIIVLSEYKGFRSKKIKFCRRSLYLRDNYTCQYCGNKYGPKNLNIDHVHPKSKGGQTIWTNVVTSCLACNTFKADKTLDQCEMKLLKEPIRPSWEEIENMSLGQKDYPQSWDAFVSNQYWYSNLT